MHRGILVANPTLDQLDATATSCLQNYPFYVAFMDRSTNVCIQQELTRTSFLSRGLWLIFLEISANEAFMNVDVPFSSFVVVARYQNMYQVVLEEVYRVSYELPLITRRVGSWSSSEGLSWTTQELHERRNSLHGITLRAASYHFPPFMVVETRNNVSKLTGGFIGEVWKALEERMNFKTEWFIPHNLSWNPLTGNGSDLLQLIPQNIVDAVVADTTISSTRAKIVGFTIPILTYRYSIFFHVPEKESGALEWDTYFKPFGGTLWVSVMVALLVLALVLSSLHYYGQMHGNDEIKFLQPHFTVYNALFYIFGAFCLQGGDITPKATSCRLVYWYSYIIAIVLVSAYSGILISFLAVKKETLPFTDFDSLVVSKSFHFGVLADTTELTFFTDAKKGSVLHRIYKGLILKDPKNIAVTDEAAFQRICDTKYAYMAPIEHVLSFTKTARCEVSVLPKQYFKASVGIAFSNKSQYTELFNSNLQAMMDTGVLKKLKKEAWRQSTPPLYADWASVDIRNIISLITLLAIGIILALLLLFLERGRFFRKKRPSERSNRTAAWHAIKEQSMMTPFNY